MGKNTVPPCRLLFAYFLTCSFFYRDESPSGNPHFGQNGSKKHTLCFTTVEEVEAQLVVRLGVVDGGAVFGQFCVLVVLLAPPERPRLLSPRDPEREAGVGEPRQQPLLEAGHTVSRLFQLRPYPGALDLVLVARELVGELRRPEFW